MTAAGAPSGTGVGSIAAWEAGAPPAAGLFALESLCSGALRRFMMVVTRTAFCRKRENSERCCDLKTQLPLDWFKILSFIPWSSNTDTLG